MFVFFLWLLVRALEYCLPLILTLLIAPSYQQSSKKSASADVDEGPALVKYNGKDARFKDEKDLKVGLLEITFL